jgi:hypothetical protein
VETHDLILILSGAIVGTFAGTVVNALSLRLPADLSALGSPPCHACAKPTGAGAFIPLAQMRCPHCQTAPRWHKAAVEAASCR